MSFKTVFTRNVDNYTYILRLDEDDKLAMLIVIKKENSKIEAIGVGIKRNLEPVAVGTELDLAEMEEEMKADEESMQ